MMVSSRLRYLVFFFLASVSLLCSCDTAKTIEDPTKNHFIKYYGGDGDQEGVDMVIDAADGSFYLLGNTKSSTFSNLYLVKANVDGNLIWEKTIRGKNNYQAKDIEITSDGRLVILANYEVTSSDTDILILTVDTDGNKLDSALFGYPGFVEEASTITQISDGFIVAGATTNTNLKPSNLSPNDQKDALFARFSNDLIVASNLWKTTAGPGTIDVAVKVIPITASPGNSTEYYVFGYSNKPVGLQTDVNFWYFGLNSFGENPAGDWTAGTSTDNEVLTSAFSSQSGGYLLVGNSVNANGNYDIYVSKLRNQLNFNVTDYQFSKALNVNLGALELQYSKVSVYPSVSSGYLILANEKSVSMNNFYLTKIDNSGNPVWTNPEGLIFGGLNDDHIGSVNELPDGKIVLFGTMAIGDEGQKKMALIKLNKEGKFLD